MVRAGRYDERVGLQLRENLRGDGIVVNDRHAYVQKRDLLVQVLGKEVEVVFTSTLRGRARLARKVMATTYGYVCSRGQDQYIDCIVNI